MCSSFYYGLPAPVTNFPVHHVYQPKKPPQHPRHHVLMLFDLGVKLDSHCGKTPRVLECHVGEKTLRVWLDANGTQDVAKVSFDINEVDVCPSLPKDVQARVRKLVAQYADVFAGQQNSLPKPFAAEPVELKFVANPQPHSIPEPKWTLLRPETDPNLMG
jgi:hypothetical protein